MTIIRFFGNGYQTEVIFDDAIGKPDLNLLKYMFESSL